MTISPLKRTLAFITPRAVELGIAEEILLDIKAGGFQILDVAPLWLTADDAAWLYAEECYSPDFTTIIASVTHGAGMAVIIMGLGQNTPADFHRYISSFHADPKDREKPTFVPRKQIGEEVVRAPAGPCDAISAIERFEGAFRKAA